MLTITESSIVIYSSWAIHGSYTSILRLIGSGETSPIASLMAVTLKKWFPCMVKSSVSILRSHVFLFYYSMLRMASLNISQSITDDWQMIYSLNWLLQSGTAYKAKSYSFSGIFALRSNWSSVFSGLTKVGMFFKQLSNISTLINETCETTCPLIVSLAYKATIYFPRSLVASTRRVND